MDISSFFTTYFSWKQPGFNVVNTLTYAIIALILLYGIYQLFSKLKIKFNIKFVIALIPFIFFGSSLRALVDNGYIEPSFWVVTPGIYLVTAALFFTTYLSCFYLSKKIKIEEWKSCFFIGIALLIILFGINGTKFTHPWLFFGIIGLAIGVSIVVNFFLRAIKQKKLTKKLPFLPIFGHMVDASATFIVVDFFGAWEKHPMTRYFADLVGSASILYVLKLLIVIPAVYLIYNEIEDKNFRNYLLIALATLGLAEGIRNIISIVI